MVLLQDMVVHHMPASKPACNFQVFMLLLYEKQDSGNGNGAQEAYHEIDDRHVNPAIVGYIVGDTIGDKHDQHLIEIILKRVFPKITKYLLRQRHVLTDLYGKSPNIQDADRDVGKSDSLLAVLPKMENSYGEHEESSYQKPG